MFAVVLHYLLPPSLLPIVAPPCFYADMRLQSLAIVVADDTGSSIETQLVSVVTLFAMLFNSSFIGSLSMDWSPQAVKAMLAALSTPVRSMAP